MLHCNENITILLRARCGSAAGFGAAKTTFCTSRAPDVIGKCPTTSPDMSD